MIFENEKKLLGEQEYSSTDYSLIPLLREAVSIRKKLGRKGYLLDAYLSTFLEAVMSLSDYEACEEGFSDANEFRSLCRKAVGQRPTDPVVREVYDENGWISSFQESSTRTELLQALCLDRKLSVFVNNFMDYKPITVVGIDVCKTSHRLEENKPALFSVGFAIHLFHISL